MFCSGRELKRQWISCLSNTLIIEKRYTIVGATIAFTYQSLINISREFSEFISIIGPIGFINVVKPCTRSNIAVYIKVHNISLILHIVAPLEFKIHSLFIGYSKYLATYFEYKRFSIY